MKCPYCSEEIQDTAKKCRFCGEWLKNEDDTLSSKKYREKPKKNNSDIKTDDNEKNSFNFKSKLINYFIHIIYLSLSLIVSFLYAVSEKIEPLNNNDYSEFASFFLSSFFIIYLLGNYSYRRTRGKLGENFKSNLKKFLKGVVPMIIILGMYFMIYNSNKSINQSNTVKDLDNIGSSLGKSLEKNDGDNNFEDIKGMKVDSSIGKSIQKYLEDRQVINEKYQKSINLLGNTILGNEYYKDVNEINNVIANLEKLRNITEEYVNGINRIKKENISLQDVFSSESTIELDKITAEFVESEKSFITSSIETYSYLLEIQQHIEYNNGEIGIYDDNIRNKFNSLIEIMNNNLLEYQNKTNELQKYREKLMEESMNTLQENNN